MRNQQAIAMFSGGVGSWAAAKRAKERFDTITLLFTDTLIEDPDLYRFLDEAAADVGAPLVKVADGRTPWQVFHDVRMLGNSRIAPCSRVLKQEPARRWVEENAPGAAIVLGLDWTEEHRLAPAQRGWAPHLVVAPLTERPYLAKSELLAKLDAAGIARPSLYQEGFLHNNCGGGCVRAGMGQFRHLYRARPETYAEWEAGEAEMRGYLQANVSILRDRTGGMTRPLTLRELRNRLDAEPSLFTDAEWGGCGCFVDEEEGGQSEHQTAETIRPTGAVRNAASTP